MHATSSRVLIVIGGLVPARWFGPGEIGQRLPALAAALRPLAALPRTPLAPAPADEPRELAHDRYLRGRLTTPVQPGAMTAIRALAEHASALAGTDRSTPAGGGPSDLPGWLLEPVGFHLARDHMVLDTEAAAGIDPTEAHRLVDAIQPLFGESGQALRILTARHWWLAGEHAGDWQLEPVSIEVAAGRHIGDWMPRGSDARRFRRLLNEIQMTWYTAHDGPLATHTKLAAINGVWISGPVPGAAVAEYRQLLDSGRLRVDDSLRAARLDADPQAWLQALDALTPVLAAALADPDQSVLLAGDHAASWLGAAAARPVTAADARPVRGWRRLLGLLAGSHRAARPRAGDAAIERLFTEPDA